MHKPTSDRMQQSQSLPLPLHFPRVKICGMKDPDSVMMAVKYGADAVGFITEVPVSTPRKIDRETARELVASTPPLVSTVMVCMPDGLDNALELARFVQPDAVQVHSSMSPEDLGTLKENTGVKIIKTIHIDGRTDVGNAVDEINGLYNIADAILLDTKIDGKTGGTGTVHDWARSAEITLHSSLPVILAGGLNPGNVADAIRTVRPYAVDTASGVETGSVKDEDKVMMFVNNARSVQ
ncbi:MAG: N-(5'-phosphoribosyl)anthranilate isomerase [ANME-2 cluster archaeon]|nr:N-(5'-phosphoribosyl)anthranilate isomerase [ANME-2 cluster archaeon]